ncbi:MAG: hypothetical protein ACLGIG_11730 [Actinomycetes bacterium]
MRLTDSQVGKAAVAAAAAGTVLAPVHALSRFATAEGKEDLDSSAVRAWAEPAAEALSPLLDWAGVDTVYTTYGKLWAPILLAALVCALAIRRGRAPNGAETWGWRLHLTGLAGMTVGVAGTYWTPLLEEFFAVTLPFLLVAVIGAIVLGAGLLRRGFRPRTTAVLLLLWLPLFVLLSALIAMGAGVLPVVWAWAVAGYSLASGAQAPQRTDTTAVAA